MKTSEGKNISTANDLYVQVKAMSSELHLADEVKVQLIIEYAKDAIELYGATNQERKVELRQIVERAEHIVSPDSIDSVKKRAEKLVLKFIYPRRPIIRNVVLVTTGIALVAVAIAPVTGVLGYLKSTIRWQPSYQTKNEPSTPPSKVVLILCDISASLSEAEGAKAASLAADVIDNLPDDSVYAVYPIQVSALELPPVLSKTIAKSSLSEPEKRLRRERLHQQMLGLTLNHRRGHHSCILNSVFATRRILDEMANRNQGNRAMELIIISDMVEECDETPFGRISLNKSDTSSEISSIRKYHVVPCGDLSDVRITVLFPSVGDSGLSNPRRALSHYDIKEFWRVVFNRCGLGNDNTGDQIQWVSGSALPDTLRRSEN